uniref:TlpA family protein disulfide reductase n=1 Tax=Mariniflexile sp. TaxID=1979402 RepID=UPI004047333F
MKRIFLLIFLLFIATLQAQIKGNFKLLAGQELELSGYDNFKSDILSVTNVDSLGNFTLIYPNSYKGMAILKAKDKSSLAFILTEKDLKISGTSLNEKDSLVFENSIENKVFIQYFKAYSQRQSAASAWYYLKDKYQKEAIFKKQKSALSTIKNELVRIETEDANFLKALEKTTYVSWYLPLKKLVSDMPIMVRYHTEKIPEVIKQFRSIDFNNPKFKTSGLLKELIDGYYMLLENSGKSTDSIYTQMNRSTDYLLNNLKDNESLLNDVGDYLFNYFEGRSLFKSSEYLAVQLLSQNSCQLEDKLANKLEGYRKFKIGNTAPDIVFSDGITLSSIISTKLLVFGASWCPKCEEDLSKLSNYYTDWKQKGVDVIYISIDTNKADFENTYKNVPWKTDCDFMGWNTQAVKDYHVFATPAYFLLDKDLKIMLRPNSVEQTNNWLNSKIMNN